MSVKIAWKQNILVTDFHLLKSLLVVLGFGSQAFVGGFSRQNINSAHHSTYFSRKHAGSTHVCFLRISFCFIINWSYTLICFSKKMAKIISSQNGTKFHQIWMISTMEGFTRSEKLVKGHKGHKGYSTSQRWENN